MADDGANRPHPSVILLEPFYTGSHRQLMDLLVAEIPTSALFTMTGKKWHWRARTSALYFAEVVPESEHFRVLFASSVLNLAELIALRSDLALLKKVLYFHENQLVYPVQKEKERDFQYGYNQILSCLVADVVVFNSKYNMDSFLSNVDHFFKLMPDYRPRGIVSKIREKCTVLYFPVDFAKIPLSRVPRKVIVAVPEASTDSESSVDGELDRPVTDSMTTSDSCDVHSSDVLSSDFAAVGGTLEWKDNNATVDMMLNAELDRLAEYLEKSSGTNHQCLSQTNRSILVPHLSKSDSLDNSTTLLSSLQDLSLAFSQAFSHTTPCIEINADSGMATSEFSDDSQLTPKACPQVNPFLSSVQELSKTFTAAFSNLVAESDTEESVSELWAETSEGSTVPSGYKSDTEADSEASSEISCDAPIIPPRSTTSKRSKAKCLHILWANRWEHDKDPDTFFMTLFKLQEEGYDFALSVLGEQFTEVPDIFGVAKSRLSDHILHWGYRDNRSEYYGILNQADIVISTAKHEFFGVAMLEAVYCGCYPICPKRLVYPEIFPKDYLYNTPTQLLKQLRRFCKFPNMVRKHKHEIKLRKYSWETLRSHYLTLLSING